MSLQPCQDVEKCESALYSSYTLGNIQYCMRCSVYMLTTPYLPSFWLILRALVLTSAMGVAAYANEKEVTLDEGKAHYLIEIAKHVTWPNEAELDEFHIGLVGGSLAFRNAVDAKKSKVVRGKAFTVTRIKDEAFDPDDYAIIFLSDKKRQLNNKLFKKVKNTLIIADGKVDRDHQMVSLIDYRQKLSITLNGENLSNRGFDVSISLLELAGSKEDLGEQLRNKEARLENLLQYVEEKEKNLDKINQELDNKSQLLTSAVHQLEERGRRLEESRVKLQGLSDEIKTSQEEVARNRKGIEQQKTLLKGKQQEVLMKEKSILELQKSIDINQSILDEQFSMLEKQSDIIETKDKTIGTQRGWLVIVLVVTLVFCVMIYFLLRINHLRKRTNRKLKELNAQLYELATTDSMTKLFNRRHFLESAENEFLRQHRKHTQSAMLMMDIDHFKKVNDTYGHAMGDVAIIAVADLLKSSLRQYDLVGRLGGEEYAMMLVDCDVDKAADIAARLCKEVEENDIVFDGNTINITISIGISPLLDDDTKVEQSLVRADQALYEAKESGRNRFVVYSPSLDNETST
ncbi:MAG: YfiR/HmsC family protein [Agarilytica sp.]